MTERSRQKYTLKVSSKTENLEIIRDFICRLAVRGGFNDVEAGQIELAVDEACTNAIKHAHKYNKRYRLDITSFLDKDKIEIIISDKGTGFSAAKIPEPNIEDNIHQAKKGGLGIHLMRTLMDEVTFSIDPGKKNQVIMIKYLRKSA